MADPVIAPALDAQVDAQVAIQTPTRSGWRLADLRARLAHQPALQNVLRLLAGNASAQLLTLLAYPVLTRIYTPAEIGILSVASAVVLVCSPMAALRFEMALPISRSQREAGGALVLCFSALFLTTFVLSLALWLAPAGWLDALGDLRPYRFYLPLALLAFGGYVVLVYEGTRQERFADVARTRVYQAFTGPLVQIGTGLAGLGAHGLLVGFAMGQSSGTFGLVRKLLTGPSSPLRGITWEAVREALSQHRNFALYSSWTGLITSASNNAMIIAFGFLFGPAVSGLLFLGERVLMRPLLLITTAVLPVYTKELARIHQDAPEKLPTLFRSVVTKQALLSIAWILPIVATASYLVPRVFGEEWRPAVDYLRLMSIGYFAASLMNPVLHTLQILQRQRIAAVLDMSRAGLVFCAIAAIAFSGLSPLHATLICSITLALAHFSVLAMTYRIIIKDHGLPHSPNSHLTHCAVPGDRDHE